jgi:isopentenyl-diphosphate delta-isomerase
MPATLPSTLIDVVDADGRAVGVAQRAEALRMGLGVRTVHVLVLNADGDLLVQQLGRQRDRHPLLWGSSVAGFPRPGEPDELAAARRLREEVALTTPMKRIGTTVMQDGPSQKFVTVFETIADRVPEIAEPGHIERIDFRPIEQVNNELVEDPELFTETFQHVFYYWVRQRRSTGP